MDVRKVGAKFSNHSHLFQVSRVCVLPTHQNPFSLSQLALSTRVSASNDWRSFWKTPLFRFLTIFCTPHWSPRSFHHLSLRYYLPYRCFSHVIPFFSSRRFRLYDAQLLTPFDSLGVALFPRFYWCGQARFPRLLWALRSSFFWGSSLPRPLLGCARTNLRLFGSWFCICFNSLFVYCGYPPWGRAGAGKSTPLLFSRHTAGIGTEISRCQLF